MRFYRSRYLGNKNEMEVHDLHNEKLGCHIDLIINARNDVSLLSLAVAHASGYDNCAHCIGNSTR